MALRLDEHSILSAEICNRRKHRVIVAIDFVDGSCLRAKLRGNPHRDLAGRRLTLRHRAPDAEARRPEFLHLVETGVTGDITAARKVRVPAIPREEVGAYSTAKEEVPTTWKNSVYLEWYSSSNGRVVLEATELELSVTEPAWDMSEADDRIAREAAGQALNSFLDTLCVIDREREAQEAEVAEDKPMDEFEWEKFLRHSDNLSHRYAELIDKFGFDDEETIARYMKWDHEADEEEDDLAWRDAPDFDDDDHEGTQALERRRHPIHRVARRILDSVDYPREKPDSPLANLWSAVATISAKLAGALSSYECDPEPDAGFTIAQLKRCLVHIDTAVGEAQEASPTHVQPLLRMREAVIDLQNDLRGSR